MARILFISYGVFESLAIESLSAVLKKNGHVVKLLIDPSLFSDTFFPSDLIGKALSVRSWLVDEVVRHSPDMVCFSVGTDNYNWSVWCAGEIKKVKNILTVFGGVHPTIVPDRVIAHTSVDVVCVGDGEGPLLELANSVDAGEIDHKIKNLWFKQAGAVISNVNRCVDDNLDKLPFLDKELFYQINPSYAKEYVAITSRGCHFNCTYCSNHALKKIYGKNYVRKRSVNSLMAELSQAKAKHHMRYVWFVDDLFFTDQAWLQEFSQRYAKEVGVAFFCYLHPDQINDEVLGLLTHAGCFELGIGVQTFSEEARRVIHRPESLESVKKACQLIKAHGINLVVENIVGLPHETEETLLEMARAYNDIRPALVLMNWLRLYPGVDLLSHPANVISAQEVERDVYSGGDTQIGWKSNVKNEKLVKQMVILLEAIPFLPYGMVNLFIQRRLYRFFPLWFRGINLTLRILAFSWVRHLWGKNNYDSGARGYLRSVGHFMLKRAFNRDRT